MLVPGKLYEWIAMYSKPIWPSKGATKPIGHMTTGQLCCILIVEWGNDTNGMMPCNIMLVTDQVTGWLMFDYTPESIRMALKRWTNWNDTGFYIV